VLIRKTIETGHVDRAEKLVDRFANNVLRLNRTLREKYGADLTTPPEDIAHRQSMPENPNLGKLQGALNLSQDSGSSSKGEQVKLSLLNVHFCIPGLSSAPINSFFNSKGFLWRACCLRSLKPIVLNRPCEQDTSHEDLAINEDFHFFQGVEGVIVSMPVSLTAEPSSSVSPFTLVS
jgi:hypothetical protein